ncbi:MAG TPA: N-acetylmuramoyl-L-alanine amidase [Burkholderiaceae bacterium]|jgi:N-acetylmuramoyl-L-alanine amidase|nr:N-acetylmuramoyl-L-alanine amidase [Burkholderiaceae bacterium]
MASEPRRRLLKGAAATAVLALVTTRAARAASLLAVRVWPGPDYSRVTLEHDEPLKFSHFMLRDAPPLRLVVDLQGIALTSQLKELVGKIDANDPYIARVRIAQNRPDVVRLVIELKGDVAPQLYQLDPVGPYRYRLLFDLYPTDSNDPLLGLIRSSTAPEQPAPEPGEAPAALAPVPAEPPAAVAQAPAEAPAAAASSPADEAAMGREIERAQRAAQPPASGQQPRPSAGAVRRLITVAIDAGHGGEDPGATGRRGTHEKAVTLAVAKRLASLVASDSKMRVLLTREGDYFVALADRVQKAQQVHADLFVSIHADAWVRSDARGSTVFALSEHGASSAAAAALARHENESDLIGGVNLAKYDPRVASVALDLLTSEQISQSLRFGGAVLHELEHVNRLHRARVEQAGFAVLKAPDIPSILVETAFISNPDEELRLRDEAYQRQLAQAIFNGIQRYFERNPPPTRDPVG